MILTIVATVSERHAPPSHANTQQLCGGTRGMKWRESWNLMVIWYPLYICFTVSISIIKNYTDMNINNYTDMNINNFFFFLRDPTFKKTLFEKLQYLKEEQ